MNILVREHTPEDLRKMADIWNEVVESADAFPQTDTLTEKEAADFFAGQTYTGVAEDADTGEILGLFILHPNNIGRCGHIANASYAVKSTSRGLQIGEKLVTHSLAAAKENGFRLLQFNAVVRTNTRAIRLYEKLGFTPLGVIPGGFRQKDGTFEDIIPFYKEL